MAIITVTLNPSIDRALNVKDFNLNRVCRGDVMSVAAGGKGINVSRAVHRLGGKTKALGVAGGETGRQIAAQLKAENIDFTFQGINGESRTCYSIIDNSKHTETVINETGPEVLPEEIKEFKSLFEYCVSKDDIVCLSGSAARGFDRAIYHDLIMISHHSKAKVILDTSGESLFSAIKAVPYIVKINRSELEKLFNSEPTARENLRSKVEKLTGKGIYGVVITQGEYETVAFFDNQLWSLLPPKVEPINSWGSGDSFLAGMAVGMENGENLIDAMEFGVRAGTANTLSYGAGFIDREEVMKLSGRVKVKKL